MLPNFSYQGPISGLSLQQFAKLERQRGTAGQLVNDVARIAINDFSSSSLHFREEARAERPMADPHLLSMEECIKTTQLGLFFDTVRVIALTSSGETNPVNDLAAIPDETRKWIANLFAPHKVSIGYVGQIEGMAVNGKCAIELDIKSQNLPFDFCYEVLTRLNNQPNGWLSLPNGDKVGLHNADTTLPIPFATKPTLPSERKDIFDGTFEAKRNAKYVGYMCLTYTAKEERRGQKYIRYVAQDLDGLSKEVVLQLNALEIKLYDKTEFHHITTSAYTTTGNNRQQLAYSTHDNINSAHHSPIFQENGHSRIECRWPGDKWPSMEAIYETHRQAYKELIPTYCYRESFLERMEWIYDKDSAVQVALIQHKIGCPGYYNVAVTFAHNSYTFRANTEHLTGATSEEVKHFLTATKLKDVTMFVYVERPDMVGLYNRVTIGNTDNKPNLEYLAPKKYTNDRCRAKWAQEKAENVGLASGPFQITPYPFKFSEEQLLKFLSDGTGHQPNLQTKKSRQKEAAMWVRDKLIPAIKERQTRLSKEYNIRGYKALPISEAPDTARVCGAGKTQKGYVVILLENKKGTVNLYFANAKIKEQVIQLAQSKAYLQYPIQFYKGEQTGTYNKNPVFSHAELVHGDSEKACNSRRELQEWELLFWDKDNFDKYRHIKIW
jgi:hypothetical protein